MKLILPRSDIKKQDVLSKVAEGFEKDKEYKEEEVDEILKKLEVDDFILFRRELVNFGYLGRDPYKSVYWLIKSKLSEEEIKKIGEIWK
jgi:hypothetical protein